MRNAFYNRTVSLCCKDGEYDKACANKEPVKVFSTIYYLFVQLYHLAAHKTFMDLHWEEMYMKFMQFSNLIQNFCEQNHREFKKFFCNFVPKIEPDKTFNARGQTMVFNYYVY